MNKLIRAILFDLVGVLLIPDKAQRLDDVLQSFDEMIGQCVGDIQLRSHAMKRFRLSEQQFDQLLLNVAHQYVRYQPMWELLPGLKRLYKLGIINNGTSMTFPAFEDAHHLNELFDVVLCSGREGVRKPDKQIYSLAVDRLGIPANECLFMDDSTENVAGAEAAGMRTIHWADVDLGFSSFKAWLESEAG